MKTKNKLAQLVSNAAALMAQPERICLQRGRHRRRGLISGLGRSLRGGDGNRPQCSCVDSATDRGAWQAVVQRGTESDTTE